MKDMITIRTEKPMNCNGCILCLSFSGGAFCKVTRESVDDQAYADPDEDFVGEQCPFRKSSTIEI